MNQTWELGQTGEELAADYLDKQGYQILHHNWNLHRGCEIDLVARKDGELHFIEVKTRRRVSEVYGTPEEAVDLKKQQHLQAAVSYYTSYYHIDTDTPLHLDVIAIVYKSEQEYELKFIPDIHFFTFNSAPYKGRKYGWRYR